MKIETKAKVERLTVRFRGAGGGEGTGNYHLVGYDAAGREIFSDTRYGGYQLNDVRHLLRKEFPNASIGET